MDEHLPIIINRAGAGVDLQDLYAGAIAFAHLGGPSTKQLPLELLGRRGALLMAMNNSPASLPPSVRPHLWLHNDPTRKFHPSIWYDPGIWHFSPVNQWSGCSMAATTRNHRQHGLRQRRPDGLLDFIPQARASELPAVFGFRRNSTFRPDKFLTEPTLNQGNDQNSAVRDRNGYPHVINSFFTLLKLAYYLGIRTLYLLGCDFRMEPQASYSWNQVKDQGGVDGANEGFCKMLLMLDALQPVFIQNGFTVYNCNRRSCCWTFPFRSFTDGIEHATGHLEQRLDCHGFYDPPRVEP